MSRKSLILFISLAISGISTLGFYIRPAKGIIWIVGHITSDTTWMPFDTYRVIDDTYVDPNVTLAILPGVHVQFADGFSLSVHGSLNATGAEAQPIVFTSSRISPSKGTWKTVEFGGVATSSMKHVKIQYATNGMTIRTAEMIMIDHCEISNCSESGVLFAWQNSNVTIKNSLIMQNGNGVGSINNNEGYQGITLTNNKITENVENGVYLNVDSTTTDSDVGFITISSNEISLNGKDGVYVHCGASHWGDSSNIHNVNLLSNHISTNGDAGIRLYSHSYAGESKMHDVVICSNNISLNAEGGILLDQDGDLCDSSIYNVTISSNIVTSNGANGVHLRNTSDDEGLISDIDILSNIVQSNAGDGIRLETHGDVVSNTQRIRNVDLVSNSVYSNGGSGILLQSVYGYAYSINIWYNDIRSNENKGVYVAASGHNTGSDYDIAITNNTVATNSLHGVFIEALWGDFNTDIRFNSISSNFYGLFYAGTQGNIAISNDLISNVYGMNITDGATVKAEYNFWGSPSGPYHESLNPEGQGNSINGNGIDLDFIPFLQQGVDPVIPEFPSFFILPVFMIVTLLAVILHRKKHSM